MKTLITLLFVVAAQLVFAQTRKLHIRNASSHNISFYLIASDITMTGQEIDCVPIVKSIFSASLSSSKAVTYYNINQTYIEDPAIFDYDVLELGQPWTFYDVSITPIPVSVTKAIDWSKFIFTVDGTTDPEVELGEHCTDTGVNGYFSHQGPTVFSEWFTIGNDIFVNVY